MVTCKECDSDNLYNKGLVQTNKETKRRFLCRECGVNTYQVLTKFTPNDNSLEDDNFTWSTKDTKRVIKEHDIFVIASAQNDTKTFVPFLDSLKNYCDYRSAALFIIPNRYWNRSLMTDPSKCSWDSELSKYLIENEIHLSDNLKIVANMNIVATAVNPLSGLGPITQGQSTIIGHPQLQMETVPVSKHQKPVMLMTTGSVSLDTQKGYTDSKAGYKAQFNHCNSAIVIELDRKKDTFHVRQLVSDKDGTFYDIMGKFVPHKAYPEEYDRIEALITGDEHIMFMDDTVMKATYTDIDSIVDTLKPKQIIRHDVLDSYSISHHHKFNPMLQYKKRVQDIDVIESELRLTAEFIANTTPEGSVSKLVESNHNGHLHRWLNEVDIRREPQNAKLYHELMFNCLDYIDQTDTIPDPFRIWCEKRSYEFEWVELDVPQFINGILISMHGDHGANGARGSRKNLSKLSDKSVIGHSHSPGIEKGCWQVGISAIINLEYNIGPTGWMQTHCIIYPNGKRQLINIIEGDWKLDI